MSNTILFTSNDPIEIKFLRLLLLVDGVFLFLSTPYLYLHQEENKGMVLSLTLGLSLMELGIVLPKIGKKGILNYILMSLGVVGMCSFYYFLLSPIL